MDPKRLDGTIRAFLQSELGLDGARIGISEPLVTTGLVDSAGLVRLAAVLERETGRIIPDKDLTAENFDTIERIVAYLGARD